MEFDSAFIRGRRLLEGGVYSTIQKSIQNSTPSKSIALTLHEMIQKRKEKLLDVDLNMNFKKEEIKKIP